jgi:hypothetical protein
MKTHEIDLEDVYFDALYSGNIKFLVLRNDRAYQTGDHINVTEVDEKGCWKTLQRPRTLSFVISFILQSGKTSLQEGIQHGFCVIGLRENV